MHMFGPSMVHAHASVYGGGPFARSSCLTVTCSVLFRSCPEEYKEI